jgi:cytoskeletal protein RodZ
MSLINDALKKAQRQRTGEQAPLPVLPSAGGESMEPRVVKRAKPAGFNAQMIRLGAIIGGAVIVVGGLLMWSFSKPTTSPSIQTKISQPVQATTPSSATPTATGNSTAAATTPVTTFTLNIPEPSPVKPEPVQQEPVRQSPLSRFRSKRWRNRCRWRRRQ